MSTWRFSRSLCAAVGVLLVVAQPGGAASTPTDTPSANGRTDITASKITMRNLENKAIFEGNVVLKKGTLVVHSDVMVVYLKPGDSEETAGGATTPRKGSDELPTISNRAVSLIEATGQVKIRKADGRATSRKAVYDEDKRTITLTGNPVAWQQGTCVSGKTIVMFLDDDRTIVEGGSRVMIEPEAGGRSPDACAK